jgi:hypothetical protein
MWGMEPGGHEVTGTDAEMKPPQRAVILFEGVSDQLALEALAERRGRNLAAEGVSILPMGGATNIRTYLTRFGPCGLDLRLAGLCDAAEEGDFKRGLERAGLGSSLSRHDMELLGFYVCVADLEEELIRALGAAAVEQVLEAQGELPQFRTFQKQPAWRGRTPAAPLYGNPQRPQDSDRRPARPSARPQPRPSPPRWRAYPGVSGGCVIRNRTPAAPR